MLLAPPFITMTTIKLSKLLLLIMGFCSLAGFSGAEKYVELDAYLKGRSSASFHDHSNNIEIYLNKGTRGEILQTQKLPSGNYGFYIQVQNGPNKGEKVWIYHDRKNPILELFETPPTKWNILAPKKNHIH